MDALTRYTSFRDFVARTFSEATQQAVDKALVFAAEKMEQYARYDGRPLLDHDVADPWYTGDFTETWNDVVEGCTRILEELI